MAIQDRRTPSVGLAAPVNEFTVSGKLRELKKQLQEAGAAKAADELDASALIAAQDSGAELGSMSAPQSGQVSPPPSTTQLPTPSVGIRPPAISDLLNPGKSSELTLGFEQGGPIRGPQGDDQVPGTMPDGSPARLQDGEYVLPPDVVDALGGQASLDKFVALITGKKPGPVAKPALDGQGMAQAYQYGGRVDELPPFLRQKDLRFRPPMPNVVATPARRPGIPPFLQQQDMRFRPPMSGSNIVAAPATIQEPSSEIQQARKLKQLRDVGEVNQDQETLAGRELKRQIEEAESMAQPPTLPPSSAGGQPPFSSRPLGRASVPPPSPLLMDQPEAGPEVVPGASPTQRIYRREGAEGEPEFYGVQRAKPRPGSIVTEGPRHDQVMANIEAQAALRAARKLAAMPRGARGRLSADDLIGTQHRQNLQARQLQDRQRAHELELAGAGRAGAGQPSMGDMLGVLNYQRNVDKDAREVSRDARAAEAARQERLVAQAAPVVQGLEEYYPWMMGKGQEFYNAAAQDPRIASGHQITSLVPQALAQIGEQAKEGAMTPLEYGVEGSMKQLSAEDLLKVLEGKFDDAANDDDLARLQSKAARYVMDMIVGGQQ